MDLLTLAANVTTGPTSKTSLELKDKLDPYTKTYSTEMYDDVEKNIKDGDWDSVGNLLDQFEDIGLEESNSKSSMKSRMDKGDLTQSEYNKFESFLEGR